MEFFFWGKARRVERQFRDFSRKNGGRIKERIAPDRGIEQRGRSPIDSAIVRAIRVSARVIVPIERQFVSGASRRNFQSRYASVSVRRDAVIDAVIGDTERALSGD